MSSSEFDIIGCTACEWRNEVSIEKVVPFH